MFSALATRFFVVPLRVHELGGDKVAVGLLATAFTVTAALLSLPAGFLADRFGTRPLMLFAMVTGGVSQVGVALSPGIPPMFLWQALGGLCGGAAQAAMMSALADAVPAERLGRAIGWLTLAFQFGFFIGPAGAGVLAQWLSLQGVLAASTALFALSMALTVAIPAKPGMEVGWNLVAPLREISRRPGFLAACAGMLGATLVWGTLQAYLPLFGKEQLRLPEAQIGYLIAIQALANGLARIPGGRLVDRLAKRGPIVIVGLASYAATLAVLPHLSGFWPPTLLLAGSVPLLATVYLALGVVFANLATRETRGVAMGLYGLMLFIGLGLGPAIFGPVMERGGYAVGFTACAITGVLIAGVVAVLRTDRFSRRPAPRPYLP
jgi:MFS family permease